LEAARGIGNRGVWGLLPSTWQRGAYCSRYAGYKDNHILGSLQCSTKGRRSTRTWCEIQCSKKADIVRRYIVRAEDFADLFNAKVTGAYRQVTADDIRLLTQFGLIDRYGFYDTRDDLQTVIGILNYEQLRENRQASDEIRDGDGVIHCRRCGVVLARPDGKRGRPKEYCPDCESSRITMRGRKWRRKMKAARN
jgi:hypothetical protein